MHSSCQQVRCAKCQGHRASAQTATLFPCADRLAVCAIAVSASLHTWFMVDVPGKMGFPSSSSPRMQPLDHMSTPYVYLVEPSRISGARYHL